MLATKIAGIAKSLRSECPKTELAQASDCGAFCMVVELAIDELGGHVVYHPDTFFQRLESDLSQRAFVQLFAVRACNA